MRKRNLQQLRLSFQYFFSRNRFKHHRLIIGILQTRDRKEYLSGIQCNLCHRRDVFCNDVHPVRMHLFRAFLLSQAHGHHFARTAFDRTTESVMRLEPTG